MQTIDSCKFKRKLGLNLLYVFNFKQQTVLGAIKDAFEGESIQTEYSVLGYIVGLYFHDYKLSKEVDEFGYSDRNRYWLWNTKIKSNRKRTWFWIY